MEFESLPARHSPRCGLQGTAADEVFATYRRMARVIDAGGTSADAGPGGPGPRAGQGILRRMPCDREDDDAPPLRRTSRNFDLDQFPRTLIRGISSGHPDMPQVKFSPQDARDVRDYLRTIQE
jgi:hypothetical protein